MDQNILHFPKSLRYSASKKPRTSRLTSVIDKGIGVNAAEDLMQTAADFIDIIKFGWTTWTLSSKSLIQRKISLYKEHGIMVKPGGTSFEYLSQHFGVERPIKLFQEYGFNAIEISDGVSTQSLERRNELIQYAKNAGFVVFTEVGKKDKTADSMMTASDRRSLIKADIKSGAFKVILEARADGKGVGVMDIDGKIKKEELTQIISGTSLNDLIIEAPQIAQQISLIQMFGSDVNMGNILPADVIGLETLRAGLRADTYLKFGKTLHLE